MKVEATVDGKKIQMIGCVHQYHGTDSWKDCTEYDLAQHKRWGDRTRTMYIFASEHINAK